MGSVEMSLDDIIAMNRKLKPKTGGPRRGGNGGGARRAGGGGAGGKFQNDRRPRYRDLDAPESAGGRSERRPSFGGNPSKIVRINLSNLATTVVSSDLEELFAQYNIEAAAVHYNELGESLGTGDVFLRKKDATRALTDFNGVALDGEVMRMVLVDGSQQNLMSSRVQFPDGVQRRNGGGVQRRNGGNRGGFRRENRGGSGGGPRKGAPRRDKKPQKTMDELDAELDAYMLKGKE